jgi:alpha,alpha-trehalase
MVNMQRVGYKQLREYLLGEARKARLTDMENDWDACFYAQGAGRAGISGVGRHVVERLLGRQHDNGFIPQFKPSPLRPGSYPRVVDQFHCKPFLAQTLLTDLQISGNGPEYYERFLPNLTAYLEYYDQHRRSEVGLYHWLSEFESGVNTNIEIIHVTPESSVSNYSVCQELEQPLSVDLNSYLVVEFRAFADLLEACGNYTLARVYRQKADDLQKLICDLLWNPQLGMFSNVNAGGCESSPLRSWTGWLPVVLGLSAQSMTETVVRENLLNEEHFLCRYGLSSLSKDEPLFNLTAQSVNRALVVTNWFGPLWVLPNVLAVRFLSHTQWREQAVKIAHGVLDTLCMDLSQNNTLHANYNPNTGQPLAEPNFLAWNLLALELLPLVDDGFRAA